ncbi:phosphatase and actin regulator 2 isoform X3 [Ammospiza caudacuta]|uniref:phosphatase and actin regulator 2 isoform X3 n=1 Tax=Ammospiza caudacuta TaxID=2857398 RepID=UPI00273948E2|nr:phosphatase and actin regulator 2 isoform X3 [Ammospiza caudacuta]
MGQTSVSTLPEPAGVDGLDKASIANSDGPAPGSQTPPFKRKGKLSNIGKIFKPWKWRKKKTSDKFRETSAVLERKISTRQSREELIRRGVLKEMPEQDGDVTVNFETSNGHTVAIGEETIQEENLVKASGNNGTLSEKASASEGKKEDQKAGSSHAKKLPVSKSSSSPSPSSTSSHPKASKETSSKSGTSGTPRGKKKPGKQSAPRTAPDGAASSPSGATADSVAATAEKPKAEQTPAVTFDTDNADQPSKLVVPPPPTAAPPPPPLPPPFPAAAPQQPAGSSDGQDVSDSPVAGPPGSDMKALLLTERGTDPSPSSAAPGSAPGARGDRTESLAPKEDQEGEAPDEAFSELLEEASDAAAPPESESSRDSHGSDSDSDGPILYTDDDDDDDDDDENASTESSLASKIRRRDTLAIKLGNRPSKKELEDKNILQRTSEEERQEIRHQIGTKLVRRLSQRPTTEELEQRNILKQKNEEEEQEAKREIKRRLSRKLSLRPTVAELQARRILRFNEYVEVTESPDYDRRADKPWARLTPADKAAIRKELNEFKSTEMEVHEESRQFTRFHRP